MRVSNSFKETFGLFYNNQGDLFVISDAFYNVIRQYVDYGYDVIFGGLLESP